MAELNGKTPAVLAKEIVTEAITPQLVEVDGVCSQNLDVLVRKEHRDEIDTRGERFWAKNRERFRNEFLVTMINKQHKQLLKYLSARERTMAQTYYDSLIKSGMSPNEAHGLAFNGKE